MWSLDWAVIQVRAEFCATLPECALDANTAHKSKRTPFGQCGLRMFRLTPTSSRDRACLNTRIVLLAPTKGRVRRLRIPTLPTVSLRDIKPTVILQAGRHQKREDTDHTPRNSMCTSRQNALLKRWAKWVRLSLDDLYTLYAKEICSRLSLDSKPT
jgi:hypothetical protein